ncbi:MAG: Hsp20/alpha crystallin family protein [Desulfobulbaceae bacterium]|nr:Hsp20/alpha crystallin family protein [Desulfobulbaceae bacterium]
MWTRWSDVDRMFNAMDLLQNRMNRMFPDYGRIGRFPVTWDVAQSGPKTNLSDAGDHLELKVEVPGMVKEDLNIRLQGNYLEISGSRKSDTPEGYTVHRVERGMTTFTRSFTLPADVDSEKVEATLSNGLLTLVLPKSETAKPKQIAIN